jgi:hypothetical protein
MAQIGSSVYEINRQIAAALGLDVRRTISINLRFAADGVTATIEQFVDNETGRQIAAVLNRYTLVEKP